MTKPSRRRSNGREMPVSDRASSEAKAARDSGVSAASPPPVTTASASPDWTRRMAVPIAFAPAAHADTTPKVGPSSPWRIETWPGSALPIMSGTVSGETRVGPRSRSVSCCSSIVASPPIPVPMTQPMRSGS